MITSIDLGGRCHDVTHRPLVMGILNRTRDSFYDRGAHHALDRALAHVERLLREGADLVDVGARPAGVGVVEVGADEEAELVVSTIEETRRRLDAVFSVDTWRASVAEAAFAAGAVLGNDVSGFSDPGYLPAAAAAGAAVVATHMRLAPGVFDPAPPYRDVVEDVVGALRALAGRATAAGIPANRVIVDPGLDLGKTWRQTVDLLAHLDAAAAVGHPVLCAASNKIFLGELLGLPLEGRAIATAGACTVGALLGARVLRVHDARLGRQVADLCAAVLEARDGAGRVQPARHAAGWW